MLIGEENEEYESHDEEYATVEVSWDTVMLGDNTIRLVCWTGTHFHCEKCLEDRKYSL